MRTGARTVVVDGSLFTEENVLTAERVHFFDRLPRRHVRHALTLSAVAVLTVSVASALRAPAAEAALPLCGGNQTALPPFGVAAGRASGFAARLRVPTRLRVGG